jgi:hypothetical protein
MKTTLYKLKQGYVLISDEEIKDVRPYKGRKHLEKENIINTFPTYLTDLSECKLILSESPDFSLLSEEDAKRIGWFYVEKLAENEYLIHPNNDFLYGHSEDLQNAYKAGVWDGVKRNISLTADRRFTEDDIKQAYYQGRKDAVNSVTNKLDFINPDDYIKSISQPKSWEVEYKEENGVYKVTKIL